MQVRATDTGGNIGVSNVVLLEVVPDTLAPVVQSLSVAEGESVFFVRSLDLRFNEPIDLTRFDASAVTLVEAGADGTFGTGDDAAAVLHIDSRANRQHISLLPHGYLPPGQYRLTIDPARVADTAGNALASPIVRTFTVRPASEVRAAQGTPEVSFAPSANPGQEIGVPVRFDPATAKLRFVIGADNGSTSTRDVLVHRVDVARGIAYFSVPTDAISGDVTLFSQVGQVQTIPPDGVFPLQIVPIVTDAQIENVAYDGSTVTVLLSGYGFVEGGNSEYRFGNEVALDAGGDAVGANVFSGGTRVRLTLPLSDATFGPIGVRTAGGSALYTVDVNRIESVALSGTPADAAQASANSGQTITLHGAGLSTTTDLLLGYVDSYGTRQIVRLSPSEVAADGHSATLTIPTNANGTATLQVLAAGNQTLLQIVPTLARYALQYSGLSLYGSGFVEGASTFTFAGTTVTDNDADSGVSISYGSLGDNGQAYLDTTTLPRHGLGTVRISTSGGTSTALDLNLLHVAAVATALSDVAVDGATGALWTSDYVQPGHLLRIDRGSGEVLQSIDFTAAYGGSYSGNTGLQVLSQAMTLGATNVPAGSLLVFNGAPTPERVIAVDPTSGSVLATLNLAENHDLTAGIFDPTTGHLLLLQGNRNALVELDPLTGATLGSRSLGAVANIGYSAGLTIDPVTGNLWIGSYYEGGTLREITRSGSLVRTVNLESQGVDGYEITGLAFDTDGKLLVASTQGVIYKVNPSLMPL